MAREVPDLLEQVELTMMQFPDSNAYQSSAIRLRRLAGYTLPNHNAFHPV